jgi:hypothetical protein
MAAGSAARALAAAFLCAAPAVAEDVAPPPAAAPAAAAPCSSPDHRAFDFWLGAWRVELADGKHAGQNTISAILGGCALLEQWEGASGSRGTSLSAWDAAAKRWRQTWVDAAGGTLLLEGGLEDGAMVLRGVTREGDATLQERITWSRLDGARVRQHWQQSRDGGASWTDVFDGIYARR